MNACWSSHYSSPPPERELCVDGEHRSRRDMSPQGRKRAALMISRDQPATIGSGYPTYRKVRRSEGRSDVLISIRASTTKERSIDELCTRRKKIHFSRSAYSESLHQAISIDISVRTIKPTSTDNIVVNVIKCVFSGRHPSGDDGS